MRYDVSLLTADILDELEKLSRLREEYDSATETISMQAHEVSFYDRAAIGYILHGFYNGCENIFRCIGRFFENDLGPQSWHRDLLKRMRLDIPGYRPRVIDDELYLMLDDFRSFRHKFRHSYSFDLDWDKERMVALLLPKAFGLLDRQIKAFLNNIEQISPD